MFAQKLSAWKFKDYQCVGIENAQETQERLNAAGLDKAVLPIHHVELAEVHPSKV